MLFLRYLYYLYHLLCYLLSLFTLRNLYFQENLRAYSQNDASICYMLNMEYVSYVEMGCYLTEKNIIQIPTIVSTSSY